MRSVRDRVERRWGATWLAVLLGVLSLSPALQASGAELLGTPPITLHAIDLPVYPQNFAVASDGDGLVWVGNTEGVLTFDGAGWQLTRMPNREIVRSLAAGASGELYVGGYNGFGYIDRDPGGAVRYHPLEPLFADALGGREFADIWHVLVAPECVYFQALHDLFCWRPRDGRVQHWHHPGRFGAIGRRGDATWLQFRGEGLRVREGDDWRRLPASASLTRLLFHLLPLPGGDLLTLGVDGEWWRLDGEGRPRPQAMPALLPSPQRLQTALARTDGSLVFASSEGELFVVEPDLQSARRFRLGGGFLSGITEAPDGGLLVSSNSGLHHLRWPSRWTLIGEEHGLQGALHGTAEWRGTRWLLSASGAQPLTGAESGGDSLVGAPRWGDNDVVDLLPIDAERALLAQTRRLAWLVGEQWQPIGEALTYPRMLQRSRADPQRVLVGTEFGLWVVDLSTGSPRLSTSATPDLAVRINSLVESADGTVWAGSERHGVWRFRLQGWPDRWEAERMDAALGIETGPVAEATVQGDGDGVLRVSTSRGFWEGMPPAVLERVDLGGLEALRGEEEHLRLVQVDGAPRWAYSHARVFQRAADGWHEQSVGPLRRGAIDSARVDDTGRLWVISSGALLIQSVEQDAVAEPPLAIRLREVWVENEEGLRRPLPLAPAAPPEVVLGQGATHFAFAAMDLDQPGSMRYRGRLDGEETQFSEWASANTYTYFGLKPGRYTMHIQARDGEGRIADLPPYTLVILPRWFETPGFQAAMAALLLAAGVLVLRLLAQRRVRRISREKQALEREVGERTQELAEANRQLRAMAELDGLTGLANRRRLDAYLPLAWTQCERRVRPLSVLLADVDHFKQYNDAHGHLAGDELIRRIADLLRSGVRRSEDLVARYGGEEFIVVLPGATLETAAALAEQLRAAAEAGLDGTTISIGVASTAAGAGGSVSALLASADAALYRAKDAGRNCVRLGS